MARQTFTQGDIFYATASEGSPDATTLQANAGWNYDFRSITSNATLQLTDAGRYIASNGSNVTLTVPASTAVAFTAGDTIQVVNYNSTSLTIAPASGVTINNSGGLILDQYQSGTLLLSSTANTWLFFLKGKATYGAATGGTSASRTIGGLNYTVLTFSSNDNLVVSRAGLFDVLLLGGGGGGAGSTSATGNRAGGGGGSGALIGLASTTTLFLTAGTYAVTVGTGGAGGAGGGGNGSPSRIGTLISAAGGGGAGGSTSGGPNGNAQRGGSAGGNNSGAQTTIDSSFGKDGGSGTEAGAGGGGGYSTAGGSVASTTGGAGGNGVDVSSWGTSGSTDNVSAGGGGGGQVAGGSAGTGGVAGKTSGAGNAATTAGSGGGGTCGDSAGGNGAAGKVWIRFRV